MQNLAGPSFSPLQHRSNNLKDKGGPKDRDFFCQQIARRLVVVWSCLFPAVSNDIDVQVDSAEVAWNSIIPHRM